MKLEKLQGMPQALSMAGALEDFMRTNNIRELAGIKLRFPVWAEVVGREITDGDRWAFTMRAMANTDGPEANLLQSIVEGHEGDSEPTVDEIVLMVDTAILRLANSELVTQGEFTSDTPILRLAQESEA